MFNNNNTKGSIWEKGHLFALVVLLTIFASLLVAGCTKTEAQTLVTTNPDTTLDEFTIYKPQERVSDPRAQEEEYVYLVIDKDAVELPGPWISSGNEVDIESLFKLADEGIEHSTDGFRVMVNSRLIYLVSIDDFEDEVSLARVELIKEGATIESQFIFTAIGNGVAHDVTISAVLDGTVVRSTNPISIEVGSGEEGIQVSIKRIANEQEIELEGGEVESIPFTNFAFIIDFNSPIEAGGQENTVVAYRQFWKEWANTSVKAYAQEGTIEDCHADFFFPEDDPANEIDVKIEILGDECISVSPVTGQFPAASQIVLALDFGEFAPPGQPPCREGYIERVFTQ